MSAPNELASGDLVNDLTGAQIRVEGPEERHGGGTGAFEASSLISVRGSDRLSSPALAQHDEDIAARRSARRLYTRQNTNDTATPDPSDTPPLLSNATVSEVDKARALVKDALVRSAAYNKARVEVPLRNQYTVKQAANPSARIQNVATTPDFDISDEVRKAAALVAEADAWAESGNGTSGERLSKRAVGAFWMDNIAHNGKWPFGKNSADFKVFRDVTQYGAKGDGVTDDTAAIKRAVAEGNACGAGCYSSTTKGAIIYFPPGTYLVSSTIETHYGTQFIGDAISRPVIKAAASFIGLGVISTDKYVENGGIGADGNAKQWYINTANFYRQIRNFVIDITATDQGAYVAGLHYQVAQATSLQFVEFRCSTAAGTTQQAIYAENGSGGFMSDLVFNGGAFGIYGGSQQFTSQRLTFNNVKIAVQLIWDWGWTWKSIQMNDCGIGFKLIGENGVSNTGSVMIIDSIFRRTMTAVLTYPATTETGKGSTGVTFDNVRFDSVSNAVIDTMGKIYLAGSIGAVDTWVMGRIYADQKQTKALSTDFKTPRAESLTGANPWGLPKNPYFERTKPQYAEVGSSAFVKINRFCPGDGTTDVTACFQSTINEYASAAVIYIDAGSYILTDTVTLPANVRIVGEAWSQLVASGSKFGDPLNPRPMLRVGQPGQSGNVELQDLIFTSKGATPGLIMIEWNVQAAKPGSAGMWDCHTRSGGAVGTQLESTDCPSSETRDSCKAGSMLMHVTDKASGYFENVWLWVADHDIDDKQLDNDNNVMPFTSVYVARGVLIESKTASWYYGTSSEHSVYYQYALQGAENVYMAMIQTEEAYYQPFPKAPNPFPKALGLFKGDPPFNEASEASGHGWALRVQESSNVQIHGAGLYSWFQKYTQECVDTINCQTSLVKLAKNGRNVRIHNLVTIGGENMIDSDGTIIKAKDNLAVNFHPYWSQIAVFDPVQSSAPPTCPATDGKGYKDYEMPLNLFDQGVDDNGGVMFLTLFNGSPYTWKRASNSNSYQIDAEPGFVKWHEAFVDIPPGESLTVPTIFAQGAGISIVDDRAEIYYSLEGTDKKFYVYAHVETKQSPKWRIDIIHSNLPTKDVANGATVNLPMPADDTQGRSVQWGLVGSESFGYWSVNPPVTWMRDTLSIIGERKVKHICMPGSHDAGISLINGKTLASNQDNTQTQILDIYRQLVRGSRFFDIRPCLGNGGKHMLCHYTQDVGGFSQGANGQSVSELIADVNNFMRDYPGELVILDINNEAGFNTDNGPKFDRLTSSQWDPIITEFSNDIKNPCSKGDVALAERTMNSLIGKGGCVVMSLRNIPVQPKGNQFGYDDAFRQYNSYSDTVDVISMGNDQASKLKMNRVLLGQDDADRRDQFMVFSWTLTWGSGDVFTSIHNLAAIAFTHLFGYGYHSFTPYSYPNVLYVDYLGEPNLVSLSGTQEEKFARTTNDIVTLALAVNLQLASQNCHVGGSSLVPRSIDEPCLVNATTIS
ncbi:Glucan 1,3-beta-glucosidase-like protein 1 [Elsinoe fawcettii]|nr:Glucan 1,3-beta-glucosidase-like protein 1 [Elsinoe fawcettii]